MSRPLIAHVVHRLDVAGAEVLAVNLARKLSDRYRFAFLCLDQIGRLGQQLAEEGFAVQSLHRRPGLDWATAGRMYQAVQQAKADLIHAHQYTPFFYASISRGVFGGMLEGMFQGPRRFRVPFRGRGRGPGPVIFTEHGRHYPDRRKVKRVIANKLLLHRFDRATAIGHFVKQALVDHEGVPAHRIEVIHNGIDTAPFERASVGLRASIRRELGVAMGQPVVLQVARFHPVKDHTTSIRAFAHVAASIPDALLLLVGDGARKGEAKSLVSRLGIDHQVRFLGLRTDVPNLMAGSDVFVLSSLSEGISLTLLEAMAARLPIAATDVGGNREVVVDGQTGLLAPRGNADGLARQITTLLRDAGLRQRMGEAGVNRVKKLFNQQRMHQCYERIYEQMLRKDPHQAQRRTAKSESVCVDCEIGTGSLSGWVRTTAQPATNNRPIRFRQSVYPIHGTPVKAVR